MSGNQQDVAGQRYEIRLKGHLDENYADWFEDLIFSHESDGSTILKSENMDQAALHGLLKRIRDLGLPLLSVNQLDTE
jgi:hypothetical protein